MKYIMRYNFLATFFVNPHPPPQSNAASDFFVVLGGNNVLQPSNNFWDHTDKAWKREKFTE